jgi:drug/metabolite transporter (DMT)-like permease
LSIISLLLIAAAFYGTYLIATSYRSKEQDTEEKKKYNFGVIMGLLSAFTETMIFLFVRSNTDAKQSPFYAVNHIYLIGLVGLLAYGVSHPTIVDHSSTNWMKLIGFNALLGFTGYIARFYSISNIPTIVFSLMSFIGVAFGYAWTILFTKDKITIRALFGGGLIAGSIAALRYFDL